jgi:hypothetical protein
MADKKAPKLEFMRPARRIELGDFALAAFYPQTRSGAPLGVWAVETVSSGVKSGARRA